MRSLAGMLGYSAKQDRQKMKAIEVTGKIDQQGNLVLDEPIRDYAIALSFKRFVWKCDRICGEVAGSAIAF
jgi:hypothetical protein